MRFVFLLVFIGFASLGMAQKTIKTIGGDLPVNDSINARSNDSLNSGLWKNPNNIQDYKIFNLENDTTFVDTTLTIYKDYKFNYLRKDNFELLPLSNVGQTYNRLSLDADTWLFPQSGQRSKYYNWFEAEDINYYSMPTPLTEWFFKTTFEQGQLLDASISFNTSKQLNFYIAYKGMKSLGKYKNLESSTGNFRFSTNYHSVNDRYDLKVHFVGQDIKNQENAGILYNEYFTSGEEDFQDRSRLEVILEDAESLLVGKRYFIRQQYALIHDKDSVRYNVLNIGHKFNYETKSYYYTDGNASDYFGDAYVSSNMRDQFKFRTMENHVFAELQNNLLGNIGFRVINYNYNYMYRTLTNVDGITIPSGIKANETAVKANYEKQIGGFDVNGYVATTLVGDFGGTDIYGEASYDFNDDNRLEASIHINDRMPNFNYLMYQSDYINYNWYNVDSFEKEQTKTLHAKLSLKKIANIDFTYSMLDNYTYFQKQESLSDSLTSIVKPAQYSGTINYLKLKLEKEFKLWKFALNNTIMYQEVVQDDDILNVPQFVTRNTFYFSTPMFKNNLQLQTGLTLKYFTKYYTDEFNPLLSEFSVQNNTEIGEYPIIDAFLDFKIRQTRFFFKAEHINNLFSKEYNYYSTVNTPYRDFVIRFGLVWNLFS
ncbi:hypothetical protein NBRC110019_30860 [Neptunitalea chrysea]|uniref:Porin n=1 Tax=Neptunitalea chrysea TaxID=1647581 RepID=A0A9W6B8Y0_9FLAO|nr:putative porin [Neptunitalea chrysea]GLB54045.1 hypothetical protein NBRC110019_30860 [Neptunitalea chrysea]